MVSKIILVCCLSIITFVVIAQNPCTITMKPGSKEGKDATVFRLPCNSSYGSATGRCDTGNMGNEIALVSIGWTFWGTYGIQRFYLEYDLDTISNSSCKLDSAILTLYYAPTSNGQHRGATASYFYRVSQPWNEQSINWLNKPPYHNSVLFQDSFSLTPATSGTQNYKINITDMAKYWVANPATNYGLHMRLQNESIYSILIFASSDFADSTKWPELRLYVNCPPITTMADTNICKGDTVQLNATGGISYSWSPNIGLSDASIANPLASPDSTTTYIVTGFSGLCYSSDTLIVIVNAPPAVAISIDTAICLGQSTPLIVAISPTPFSVQWEPFISLINANTLSPKATPNSTTTYTVTVIDSSGCSFEYNTTVTVHPLPITNAEPDTTITKGTQVWLNVVGGNSYFWYPPIGLNCTQCQNPIATPEQTTTYFVDVTDLNGCLVTDSLTIIVVQEGAIYIPNAFTPNNDNWNDILYVYGDGIKEIQFIIYDRWGNKVFESNNTMVGWDGRFKGDLCNAGVYVYYFEAIYENNLSITKQGDITLIR